MDQDPAEAQIYLLEDADRRVTDHGPAVLDTQGNKHEVPEAVYEVLEHVTAAMRAGYAVKVTPLRTELPIGEAADAIGMGEDDLRRYVASGELPFRSSRYVDWVRLADVIDLDNKLQDMREECLQTLLDQESSGGS